MRKTMAYVTSILSLALGGGSLLGFMIFLYAGPLNLIDLGLEGRQILMFDVGISLLFFAQHSIMIRQSFRRFAERFIPDVYGSALYSISSGLVLTALIVLWQGSETTIASAEGTLRIVLRVVFFLSIMGFYLAVRALKRFDAFGVARIMSSLKKRQPREMPFVAAGAYRIVRHPLYVLNLTAIWAYPDLTADRLVFNVLWTIWIVAGTLLEEKDLIREFGNEYLDYQRDVPMLIPSLRPLRAHSNTMEVQS
jgi:methanethiol S-methyltransferase